MERVTAPDLQIADYTVWRTGVRWVGKHNSGNPRYTCFADSWARLRLECLSARVAASLNAAAERYDERDAHEDPGGEGTPLSG